MDKCKGYGFDELVNASFAAAPHRSTGFKCLDDITKGGFEQGTINLIAGSPKSGKSWAMISLAMGMAEKSKVVYVSCENGVRIDSQRFRQCADYNFKKPADFRYFDIQDTSGTNGLNKIKQIVSENSDFDTLFIDAPERVVDTGGQDEIHRLGREFVDYLITIKHRFLIVCSWQLTKSASDGKTSSLSVSNLSGSCALGQAADSYWFVFADKTQKSKERTFWCGNARQDYRLDKMTKFEVGKGFSIEAAAIDNTH